MYALYDYHYSCELLAFVFTFIIKYVTFSLLFTYVLITDKEHPNSENIVQEAPNETGIQHMWLPTFPKVADIICWAIAMDSKAYMLLVGNKAFKLIRILFGQANLKSEETTPDMIIKKVKDHLLPKPNQRKLPWL